MIRPLSISADGYLCNKNTLSIAINGYICIDKDIPLIDIIDNGDSNVSKKKVKTSVIDNTYFKFLKEDDQEVLIILKSFLKCQN